MVRSIRQIWFLTPARTGTITTVFFDAPCFHQHAPRSNLQLPRHHEPPLRLLHRKAIAIAHAPAPSSHSRQNCVDPVHSLAVVDGHRFHDSHYIALAPPACSTISLPRVRTTYTENHHELAKPPPSFVDLLHREGNHDSVKQRRAFAIRGPLIYGHKHHHYH